MRLFFNDYSGDGLLCSVALSEDVAQRIAANGRNVLLCEESGCELRYEDSRLSLTAATPEKLNALADYDVLFIRPNGLADAVYLSESGDALLFVTGNCNSNCIMCPSSIASRVTSVVERADYLLEFVDYLPSDLPHVTITGGEPLLLGEDIFPLLNKCGACLPDCEFLLLTNGRGFCQREFSMRFQENSPSKMTVAVPIHGSTELRHDRITQVPGSFRQTLRGVKNLLALGFPIELRVVVSKLNADDIHNMVQMFLSEFTGSYQVHFLGLEMTGSAALRAAEIWMPYGKALGMIAPSIDCLVENGLDVALYNFPLCAVPSGYHSICAKSISSEKVLKSNLHCLECTLAPACGGVFSGSYRLAKRDLKAWR